ncbi:MAG: NapC/NirT family cytochrome c [Chromatiales bacterium]|jgi:nitrate/TMAO reductase-like tetraheme cytochrome c subunit|nr:NapC/NirT family cytochrome c [Chromatiales bacterium]MDX9767093.1 NapC/NirT family cytochrome c [Ectothiorhodospiraceae bacterium]
MLKKLLAWLRRPAHTGYMLLIGGVAGIIFWGGFNTAMEQTNTMGFCISCHEMEQTVYQEYKESVHYKNASGVRAICSDCHVPRDWVHKVARKIRASNELWHKMVGTIDTPEKFEARRLVLAERVWKEMNDNNSRECRNCHSFEAMDFHKQEARAAEKMEEAMPKNTPCIECHKGIAHKKPFVERDD